MSDNLVYLVHAAEDAVLAAFLKSRLEEIPNVTKVFVASKAGQIPTGKPWLAHIQQNLRAATTFVALLTPRSVKRHWVFYEAGAAWYSQRPWWPVAAGGIDRNDIPQPLAELQVLALDNPDEARQFFTDLGGILDDAEGFSSKVKVIALLAETNAELDAERVQHVQEAFGQLGEPPKVVLRRMLTIGGLTSSDMTTVLNNAGFPAGGHYVQGVLAALADRSLVQGDFEGRWRVKPELEATLRRCFELTTRPLAE